MACAMMDAAMLGQPGSRRTRLSAITTAWGHGAPQYTAAVGVSGGVLGVLVRHVLYQALHVARQQQPKPPLSMQPRPAPPTCSAKLSSASTNSSSESS